MWKFEQWAEDHGEHVGYCRIHKQKVLDSCDQCEEDSPEEVDGDWGFQLVKNEGEQA